MIGEEIRGRREALGLTGAQLAARAGMAPSAVSQIETGKRMPSSTSVIKLATALEVDVGDLFPKVQSALPLAAALHPPFDIDDLKEEVIKESSPADLRELQTAVEDKIEQRYSQDLLFTFKAELQKHREALSPVKAELFDTYAKLVETENYVRRVLHRSASPQLAGPAEEENE
jgi:transcriptional regulator with XRE-family HTH domain